MKTLSLKILKQDLLYFWKVGFLPGTHYVAPVILKLAAILLPLSLKWRGSRHEPPCPAHCVLTQADPPFFRV